MHMKKTEAVLLIYESLTKNGSVTKESVLSDVEMSDNTFKRDINEIRCFFAEFCPEKEIVYSRRDNIYRLYVGGSAFNPLRHPLLW
jgi:predicted DNA-binding transcriptional regulator YafY